ncbi:MAG TPA: SCP2 domain-containing protein [Arsenophonus apicola]|uniref:ubiquinone biosynthesis accessory factor UbiJ n=1 Tax=Arsenophonus TaxID=637 RepID=UPI0015D82777|nr:MULTISPECIES: SCP2 sterol-binding domain-containing protein [Arsenophonus]UBX28729.1 SCP2 sterol-binding domain-containing protein [Arsenophonus apicola]
MATSSTKSDSTIPVLHAAAASFLQNMLNKFFYREVALKSARIRLIGKVLAINLKELSQPLILIFSEQRVDVVNQWPTPADCVIKTAFVTLVQLKDKQQLSTLINDGKIVIEGDMQIVQHWSALLDAAQWDPAHYLAPYVGNVLAEGMSRWVKKGLIGINGLLYQQKNHFKDVLVEEWRMSPNTLEVLSFADKVEKVAADIAKLEQRLAKLEEKYETGRD